MKHFIMVFMFCLAYVSSSQNICNQDATITVYGSAHPTVASVKYKTDITLSLENDYYSNNPCSTLEELKTKYFTEVKKQGIDISKFENDDLGYAALGYRKSGTILRFTTHDKEEILKLNKIKMGQVRSSYVQMKTEMDDTQLEETLQAALKDAEKNAQLMAKAAGKTIEGLHAISSFDLGRKTFWQSINSTPTKLRVTAVYKLKE